MSTALAREVEAAQIARVNLMGLAVACGMGREDFLHLIRLPGPVEPAFQEYMRHVRAVAMWIAYETTDCSWFRLPLAMRQDFISAAHELVSDSPMPQIRHASLPERAPALITRRGPRAGGRTAAHG